MEQSTGPESFRRQTVIFEHLTTFIQNMTLSERFFLINKKIYLCLFQSWSMAILP